MEHTQQADNVKRPVPTLNRQNWREWFEDFKYWMIGEKVYFAITKTLREYATKPSFPPFSTDNTTLSADRTKEDEQEEDNKGFAAMKDTLDKIIPPGLDEAKQERYESAEAKILFMIGKCIDQFDREHVKPFHTAKERWDSLYQKYSKTTPAARRDDLQQITGFKFGLLDGTSVDMTVSSAWAHLVSMRGRIHAANPDLARTFTKEVLFEYLVNGLPSSFNVILQSLEGNSTADVFDKLDILETSEKKYDLGAKAESAHSSWTGKPRSRQRGKDSHAKVLCHFCEQEHYKNQCELRRLMTAMVSDFQLSKAREEDKHKNLSSDRQHQRKRDIGVDADDTPGLSQQSGQETPTEPSSEEDEEELLDARK
jgi:hypothetical protein